MNGCEAVASWPPSLPREARVTSARGFSHSRSSSSFHYHKVRKVSIAPCGTRQRWRLASVKFLASYLMRFVTLAPV
jgi:hypothetical protein